MRWITAEIVGRIVGIAPTATPVKMKFYRIRCSTRWMFNRLLFLLLFTLLFFLDGCGSAVHRRVEQKIEHAYEIDPTGSLSISNADGAVRIYGAATAEMKLQAIKKAYSAEQLNGIAVNVSVQSNHVSIETNFPRRKTWVFSDSAGTVDYTIVVPQTVKILRLDLGNGEVLIHGMRGEDTRASLVNGQLTAHNCFGNLHLAVANGALDVLYDWWERRQFSINAQITNGNVRAFIPRDASFHVIAATVNGKIANDFAETVELGGHGLSKIDMSVGTEVRSDLKIHATDGNIRIAQGNP